LLLRPWSEVRSKDQDIKTITQTKLRETGQQNPERGNDDKIALCGCWLIKMTLTHIPWYHSYTCIMVLSCINSTPLSHSSRSSISSHITSACSRGCQIAYSGDVASADHSPSIWDPKTSFKTNCLHLLVGSARWSWLEHVGQERWSFLGGMYFIRKFRQLQQLDQGCQRSFIIGFSLW
jgi:hypothetical protein